MAELKEIRARQAIDAVNEAVAEFQYGDKLDVILGAHIVESLENKGLRLAKIDN